LTKEEFYIAQDELPPGMAYNSIEAKRRRKLQTTSRFWSYPNSPDKLRGTGAKVIIFEEANYLDAKLMKAVSPLLLMADTLTIAITSPSDQSTFFAQLAAKKIINSDEWLFSLVRVDRCDLCSRNQSMDDEECPHVLINLPKHRSNRNVAIVESILDSVSAQQEVHGIITGGLSDYFLRPYIQAFTDKPLYRASRDVEVIHSFVDPSANGLKSDFVIASVFYENSQVVIAGLDAYESITGFNRGWNIPCVLLIEHVEMLLLRIYPKAHLWLYVEANLNSWAAAMYADYVKHLTQSQLKERIHIVPKNVAHPDLIGVWTDEESKRHWAF